MTDYRLTSGNTVIRKADNAGIPKDPDNRDYQEYLASGGEANADPYEPPPEPVPRSISDRQFFQQLALVGTITEAEALEAVKVGTIPPALQGFVDGIDNPDQKFAANMLLAGATVFERDHPLTDAIGEAQGMSPDQVDAFFTAAAAL